MVFFLAIDGIKTDSLSRFQVREMIESGKAKKSTLAWSHGMKGWIPLGEIPEFSRDFDGGQNSDLDGSSEDRAAGWESEDSGELGRAMETGEGIPPKEKPAPWMRLLARGVDIILLLSAVVALSSLVLTQEILEGSSIMVSLIGHTLFVLVGCLLEALLLSTWGYTPGKALFRVKVRDSQGEILSFKLALQRSLLVWVKGLALMFPWVTPIALMIAHSRLLVFGSTSWDRDLHLKVTHGRPGQIQVSVAVLIYAAYAFLIYQAVTAHLEQVRKDEAEQVEKRKAEAEEKEKEDEAGENGPAPGESGDGDDDGNQP